MARRLALIGGLLIVAGFGSLGYRLAKWFINGPFIEPVGEWLFEITFIPSVVLSVVTTAVCALRPLKRFPLALWSLSAAGFVHSFFALLVAFDTVPTDLASVGGLSLSQPLVLGLVCGLLTRRSTASDL